MPLPPAPRKPATLIDLEAVAKQRSQQTRKKASDTKPVSQTTAQVPVANGAISHALEQAPLNATQLLEVPQPDLLRTEPT
ncbi:MAG: hypothetical protein EBX54_03900, partial [Betaproteobacteria bacterium]|nr:hypothetical protein [Betaproteobacteria bacterium]